MDDNNFWICFWLGFFVTIISLGFMIFLSSESYNKRIESIVRHEYTIKLPENKHSSFKIDEVK